MKIYIYWQGRHNKEDMSILTSDIPVEINSTLRPDIARMYKRPITRQTIILGVIK